MSIHIKHYCESIVKGVTANINSVATDCHCKEHEKCHFNPKVHNKYPEADDNTSVTSCVEVDKVGAKYDKESH